MTSLRAHRLGFAYSDSVPLLSDVAFHLTPGWTGLVGQNGAGKTTLLRLLAGELRPDAGELRVEPPGAVLASCPQTVDRLEPAIAAFGAAADAQASELRGRLELRADTLDRWATLSPGERRRWQIGAALAAEPEILLLDEPTNHLDARARGVLVGALRRFDGIGIVVSHDRALLRELTTATLRVHGGTARLYRGDYDAARDAWEAERRDELEAHQRGRDTQRALARRLDDARRTQAAAHAEISTGRRMRDKNDSDARGMGARNRAAWAEKRSGRTVEVVRQKLERAEAATRDLVVEKALGRSVFVDYAPAPVPRLLELDAPAVHAGQSRVLGEVHLAVLRSSRVRVHGPNGAGKSTLVRALLAGARVAPDRILHVPQELEPAEGRALLDAVRALAPDVRGRVLSVVAALGVDPGRLLASRAPSPGEARKLMIATGLGRHVWLVVLDEPTNHLDLPSIERLEEALRSYPGALVLVTHDDRLAARCTTTRWLLRGGEVEVGDEPREDTRSADRR